MVRRQVRAEHKLELPKLRGGLCSAASAYRDCHTELHGLDACSLGT
jgi:hypothetical protein